MNTAVETTPTTTEGRALENFAIDRLVLSPLNPRQSVSDAEIEALAGSIRSVGLLQNLAGIEEDGKIGIVAGGRRLRALKLIAEQDGKADMSVPVILAENSLEAQAWANSENVARAALHPAEEIRAYRKMAETGAPVETIAKAFAVTVRHVKGRMRLADLPEPILEALAADEITLDAAAAYTVSADPERQLEVFERMKTFWHGQEPQQIKRNLMAESGDGTDKHVRFVGREAYEAAGGAIREDLFGEQIFFLDRELLAKLAEEKLEAVAKEIRGKGWKWVETALERPDWNILSKMERTYPEQAELSEEDAARYDELAELIDRGDATLEEQEDFKRLDEESFSTDQMAHAGVVLYLDYRGEFDSEYGLIKPQDHAASVDAGICRSVTKSGSTTAEKKGPYSAALAEDLAKVRTGAIQTALLAKPELAVDLLTFLLSTPVYDRMHPLGLRTDRADNAPDDDEGLDLPEALQGKSLPAPMEAKKAAKTFTAFRAKPKKERNRLLTESIAKLFSTKLAGEKYGDLAEAVADLAATDVRAVWTPTEGFFNRLKAAQLDAILGEVKGKAVTADFTKLKKKDKTAFLHRLFNEETARKDLDAAAQARIAAWLPEGMAVKQPQAKGGKSSPSKA
ncbi:ParB/RepB/Spo0J family partition protein [Pelagibius sp. Alg239-R121]|uniref:ParB/RepB/Spo0J family partition protein n=1 Tax=Pelagibius sp. Alg239-R121 TaxID=2993448 RepID=UPI0024A69DF4|nr:ParB/RepB/Spo0J family partition protein [Pelagibius sp. Alg239-R121]